MSAIPFSPTWVIPFTTPLQIKRIGPLGFIVLLHMMLFYAMQGSSPSQAAQAVPREIFVSFVTAQPEKQPEAPKIPVPAAVPKTVPVVKKSVARPMPAQPTAMPTPVVQQPETPMAVAAQPIETPAAAAPVAPTPPVAPALPKTVSGVEYIQMPQPEYPASARRMGEEGKVILRVLVNEKGRPERIDVRQSSGSVRLDEAARQAASRALFKPHLEDGKAVAVYALVPINFSIQ